MREKRPGRARNPPRPRASPRRRSAEVTMGRHYEDDDEPYVIIEKKESSLGSFVVGLAIGAGSASFHDAKGRVERRIEEARQAVELKKQQVTRAMEAGRAAARQAREDLE